MKPQQKHNYREPREPKEFAEKIIQVKRVSKKTKGGNQINFSALVVVGDNKSRAGIGFDRGPDVLSAIQKAIRKAKDNLVEVKLVGGTIPHVVLYKYKAARILLKPAPAGTGVIAGGGVRAVVEAFGVKNIVAKRMGTANKSVNVNGAFQAMCQFGEELIEHKKQKLESKEKVISK